MERLHTIIRLGHWREPWRANVLADARLVTAMLSLAAAPTIAALLLALRWPLPVAGAVLSVAVLASVIAGRAMLHRLRSAEARVAASEAEAEHMRTQASTDPVTGLANRTGFHARLESLWQDLPIGEKVALLWVDLRRFKEVNDALGHGLGDRVLSEVAARLQAEAPPGALLARFAGDAFLLAARMTGRGAVQELAARVARAMEQPVRVDGHRIGSGASLGIAVMPDDAITGPGLMQAADLALYHAKAGGRSEVRFFHDSMTRALARRKEVEAELRAAIQKDELSIFFQPIIDLATGRIRGFEALVRWFHPEKGELYPDEFIPVAEDTGLIITLGNWITAQAARAASTWPDDVMLSVNLSPVQIRAPGAALGILAALREARLDPARLELEVTENLFLEDDANTAQFMADLGEQGVRFSLDDFGTGYSSLRYIHLHPFRTIKVDRSFVSGPNIGKRSDAIIRAVAELGATLDMQIVAEGLETIDQVQTVKSAGCTLGQGWYFSRAVPDYMAVMLLAQEAERHHDVGLFSRPRLAS